MFTVFMFPNVSFFCGNNCFHTAIAGAFVHIRNLLFCVRAPSGFVYEWNIHCMKWVFSAPWCLSRLIWVRIKHQVMHRLSCLFELKSIFIHTGSWKLLCEHTCPKKCGGRIYVILKVGGTHPPCDLRPCIQLIKGDKDIYDFTKLYIF